MSLYHTSVAKYKAQDGTIRSHFASTTLYEHEDALYSYIRVIVAVNLPITASENENVRSFSRYQTKLSCRTVVKTLLRILSYSRIQSPMGLKIPKELYCSTDGLVEIDTTWPLSLYTVLGSVKVRK